MSRYEVLLTDWCVEGEYEVVVHSGVDRDGAEEVYGAWVDAQAPVRLVEIVGDRGLTLREVQ